jgi:MFS superfamily sulfate permease-like transporter
VIYLLNPRTWIAALVVAILAFTHFSAYRLGKGALKREWDRSVAEQKEAVIKAQEQARQIEQSLVAALHNTEKKYVEQRQKANLAAAGASAELERLRNAIAVRERAATQDSAPTTRADGGAGLESDLLGHCAKALVGLAQEADRLEAVVVGLQGYVKSVCQAKQD